MSYKYGFEKLEVWQDSRLFVKEIYTITKLYPAEERYNLCSQIQRAAISIVSNIAEGLSRNSDKEKVRFIEIAYGSLMEVYCQLLISVDLSYISVQQFDILKLTIDKIANKLNALNRSINNRTRPESENNKTE
ncbi:MAG: four helix bundle protein [Bacteroidota bacterium]|nr:four helix bundle protein [Bacteroidota bacterium]